MAMNGKQFTEIFKTLMTQVHFIRKGPPLPPWESKHYKPDPEETSDKDAVRFIRKSQHCLPAVYQTAFTRPAMKRFHRARLSMSHPAFETVVGAVYQHDPAYKIVRYIRRLVAVVSNLHRSFLDEGRCEKANLVNRRLPPLASFNHDPFEDQKTSAFVLVSVDPAIKSLGTKVPVISLPSCYRNDILLWLVLVHEACGHPILHSIPGLLDELQERLATEILSDGRPVLPVKNQIEKEALLAVWRYWMEEACSDVMASLNMGPAYGLGWPLFMTCLACSCKSVKKDRNCFVFTQENNGKSLLGRVRISFIAIRTLLDDNRTQPELSAQSIPKSDQRPVALINPHVAIGAIQAQERLNVLRRRAYTERITKVTDFCGAGAGRMIGILVDDKAFDPVLEKLEPVSMRGSLVFALPTMDTSRNVSRRKGDEQLAKLAISNHKTLVLSRPQMQTLARRIGQYIATVKLKSLNGHSLSDLETWDDSDEETACRIAGSLADKKPVAGMGDDAHLLAGGMLAFYENPTPKLYKSINRRLGEALDLSYECDPIWGQSYSPKFLKQ
jgi:hypothetical protein